MVRICQQTNWYIDQFILQRNMEGSRKGGINWCSKILEWTGKNMIGAGQAMFDRFKWRINVAESSKALP